MQGGKAGSKPLSQRERERLTVRKLEGNEGDEERDGRGKQGVYIDIYTTHTLLSSASDGNPRP